MEGGGTRTSAGPLPPTFLWLEGPGADLPHPLQELLAQALILLGCLLMQLTSKAQLPEHSLRVKMSDQ